MKLFQVLLVLIVTMSFFTNCSTAQKLQKNSPLTFDEVYCQSWVAGIQGGGSGINLFIPISNGISPKIQLDSVYFRGMASKLEFINGKDKVMYVGRFKNGSNMPKEIVMSSDPNEEYGNNLLKPDTKIPFDLKNSECVISYKDSEEVKYFKIENIQEKRPEHYPTAPSIKQ